MNNDLIEMIGNLSRSLFSVQRLVTGFAYVLGLVFVIKGLQKFYHIANAGRQHEKPFVAFAYVLAGAAMLFFPSMSKMLANTFFGANNLLQYSDYQPYNVRSAMRILIQTAGMLWFLRGCVLMAHASDPNVKGGVKGLLFLVAGILSMNLESTIHGLEWMMNKVISLTLST